ncbi:MAG: glycosyltransferase [Methanomicrobiales archaeon]|nr:glycosyltransferase [Methanomicrobiales archaeon]
MVKVSVIIPVYNGEAFLTDAIESVKAQTYTDWEIIAVDDGSKDRSPSILHEYGTELPGRFRLITQENQGISPARNRAIGVSYGEYIALLDSDDVWFPEKLQFQVGILEKREGVAMVYSDCTKVNWQGKVIRTSCFEKPPLRGLVFQELLLSNCIPSSSTLIRKSVLQEVGLFNPAYRIAMDYDLWLRIASKYPIEVIDHSLIQYRVHPRGISSNRAEMIHEDLDITEMWLQQRPNLREQLADGLYEKQRNFCYYMFLHHLHSVEPLKAIMAFLSWLAMGFHRSPRRRSEDR